MSTLAYTLLAASGGGGGSKFFAGFINSNGNYPRPLSTFSSGATVVSNDDGDIIVGGRSAMDGTQFQGTILYNIKNSDLSIEYLQASTWGTNAGASANEQSYTKGGGWSTGVQEGDSGGRFIAGLDGQSYNVRGAYFGKPSTWANTTNKKGADQNSTTRPRHTKDSFLSIEDNRDLHVLADTYYSPSASAYNTLRLKFKQATVDTGNVESNLNSGDCKELGSNYSSTTCRGYTITGDSNGHQFISGRWLRPFSSAGYSLPYFCRINHSDDSLEYLKYVDDDNQSRDGVENSCVHGSHLFIAYRGRGQNQSVSDNQYRTLINKINISDGSLVWSRAFKTSLPAWGGGTERCTGIDTDSDGNVYVLLRSDSSTNFNNQTDPTVASNYVRTALGRINSDGTYGWFNVLGGTIGRNADNWDEGGGNRLSCDANDGINIAFAKDNSGSTGGTANGITIARLPQDGSGTSASALTIPSPSGTLCTFYYQTAQYVSTVVTFSPNIYNVSNYTYQNSTTGQTTAHNITPNSNWTNPSGHTITTTEL